jgi:uncharacterized protein (TIGR02270 family)
MLFELRTTFAESPQARLRDLLAIDERVAAHLDGLAVAGAEGAVACDAVFAELTGAGDVFVVMASALARRDLGRLEQAMTRLESHPTQLKAAVAALSWISPSELTGWIPWLLDDEGGAQPLRRRLALGACVAHGVDADHVVRAALLSDDAGVRADALDAAADGGRFELAEHCVAALGDPDGRCLAAAARAAVLLGKARQAVPALQAIASSDAAWRTHALLWLVRIVSPTDAARVLGNQMDAGLAVDDVIRLVGCAGLPQLIPWLISQMALLARSRAAGEAFSLITGVDLDVHRLSREQPEGAVIGPNEDVDDADVGLDVDEGLPWPDPHAVEAWWNSNMAAFASLPRCFMGQTPSRAHLLDVLAGGRQRQRHRAAEWLCLAEPGMRLFPTRAPAWRQRRALQGWREAA